MSRIVVIGGGLAGLTVALLRGRAGDRVTVLEAAPRFGGQLWSETSDGRLVEHGAEGFVAGSEAVAELAAELGIEERIVEQLVQLSYGFDGRSLVALAPGEAGRFLGFQVPRAELGKGIRSFAGGMGELVAALERSAADGVELRLGARVDRIERAAGEIRVVLADGALAADVAVVATGAHAAGALLEGEFGAPARALGEAQTLSSVTVSLDYARDEIPHALDGTGFVIRENADLPGLRAGSFSSTKLPGRAPPGRALLRLFFRPTDQELALPDAEWAERAARGVEAVLGARALPSRSWVSRWARALPVFDGEHTQRIAALEGVLAGSGVVLTGAAFHGAGIDAAVRSAFRCARSLA